MPTRVVPTAYHERILDAVHHVGSNLDANRELITAIPVAEPNRLRVVLSTISPAQVIVTGTLDRRICRSSRPPSTASARYPALVCAPLRERFGVTD